MGKRVGRFLFHYNDFKKRVPLQVRLKHNEKTTIPEPIARLAYEEYSYQFGTEQSFERLHERGGFGYQEALALLADLIERERENYEREHSEENTTEKTND